MDYIITSKNVPSTVIDCIIRARDTRFGYRYNGAIIIDDYVYTLKIEGSYITVSHLPSIKL